MPNLKVFYLSSTKSHLKLKNYRQIEWNIFFVVKMMPKFKHCN